MMRDAWLLMKQLLNQLMSKSMSSIKHNAITFAHNRLSEHIQEQMRMFEDDMSFKFCGVLSKTQLFDSEVSVVIPC